MSFESSGRGHEGDRPSATPSTHPPQHMTQIPINEWASQLPAFAVDRRTMDSLVLDYLICEGFKEAAEKFLVESDLASDPTYASLLPSASTATNLQSPEQSNSLDLRMRVRLALESLSSSPSMDVDSEQPAAPIDRAAAVSQVTALLNQAYPSLLEHDRFLAFRLQQLELIELIRARKTTEALEFAQEHLSDKLDQIPYILSELERTLALLAFENPLDAQPPFSDLLSDAHRAQVIAEVNAAMLRAENRVPVSRLASIYKLMHWMERELDRKLDRSPTNSGGASSTQANSASGGTTSPTRTGSSAGPPLSGGSMYPHFTALLDYQSQILNANSAAAAAASGMGARSANAFRSQAFPMIDDSTPASPTTIPK